MRFLARLVAASVFACAGIAASDPEASLPAAVSLLSEIDTTGPLAVLNRLKVDDQQFDLLCSAIASGDATWLEVARRLEEASDGYITESLDYSVARAIPVAPARVLALVGRGFTVAGICTSPFNEPEPGVAEQYEQQALKALASLSGSTLASVAEQCAARVRLPKR